VNPLGVRITRNAGYGALAEGRRPIQRRNSMRNGTVSAILKRHGVETRYFFFTAEQADKAIRLYESGLSLDAVATELGVNSRPSSMPWRKRR
jgi:hypothetical protein